MKIHALHITRTLLMRRNWLTIFLFALALTVQVFAPAVANIASGRGGQDGVSATDAVAGVSLVEFCLASGSGKATPDKADHHRDFCPLCQIQCDGVAPLVARPAMLGKAPVQPVTLAWTVADRALPTPDPDFARQARAPPFFS